ncbi:MAG: MOP flippase family protein [Pseudomonadota bacterium]|nr:MOP flippase family protein [Pseudomonadota bacterium]
MRSTAASALLVNGIQLVQMVVLARLLPPSDFGLMGMVNVVVGLGTVLADAGLGSAVIQRREPSRDSLSSLYWMSIAAGAAIFISIAAAAPIVGSFFDDGRLEGPLRLSSCLFLIVPCGQIYVALMEKELRFRELARIEVAAGGVGLVVAVAAALTGMGVFALVWGALAGAVSRAAGAMWLGRSSWQPRVRFVSRSLEGYLGFGLYHTGQRLVNYATASVDFLLVGKLFGAGPLGLYAVAYNLANLPASRLNPALSRVFFPLFARIQDDTPRLRRGYFKMQAASSLVNLPILSGMLAVAPVAVPLLLGERWRPATLILQVSCVVGIVRSIAGTVGPLLLARGRTDLGFRWSVLVVTVQVPALYLGARIGGVLGVAVAFALVMMLVLALNYVILVRALVGACLREYAGAIWPFLWKSSLMAGVVLISGRLMAGGPAPLVLTLQVVMGIAIYFGLLWTYQKEFLLSMRSLVFEKGGT